MRTTAAPHHNTSSSHGVPPQTTPMGRPDSVPRGRVDFHPDEDPPEGSSEAEADPVFLQAD